ncbi:DUF4272 domain-containing protein [Hymenobacter monticola]|uniref:DUF4272 domain-containing protein n=1 Tax=Hymenobacter monticola TaxID=1705399 RepID=A0ABY4AZB7_9BACT|nr:DUF4272 domain-containing protein [Hymenobacter monticola]UOE32209.1 DUF4272 domain-containing protein [Hymenobacter monticola]
MNTRRFNCLSVAQRLIGCLALVLSACNEPATQEARTGVPVEHITPTPDQQARRARSEAYCRARGVPLYHNPDALFTDSEAATRIRTPDEVVDRALALCFIGLKSEGLSPARLAAMDRAYHISSKLSPLERAYVEAAQPTRQQRLDANWRYEGLHVLLWALGYADTLDYPDHLCNVAHDAAIIHDLSERQFRTRARLRSKRELLDQADLVLRLDWACNEARVTQQPVAGNLNPEVVVERHHALNWLIGYLDQAWDDVSTDT